MRFRRAIFLFVILVGALSASEDRQKQLASLDLSSKITGEGWNRIGVRDHYGINVPLLCLHSQRDSGCGEFYDLFPLIDWMQSMGMDILQFLPLNDTGGIVSPYSPLSFYALHPIYLSLEVLPYLRQAPQDFWSDLKEMKALNKTDRVDYFEVLKKKEMFLEEYVSYFKSRLIKRTEYQEFLKSASYWITDYALYKVLVKRFGSSWMKWPKDLQYPSPDKMKRLKEEYAEEMHFYQIVQSLCFEQMEKVRHYANQHGVFLLGDLTFLIDTNSSEVWRHPDFFKIDKSVGVPVEKEFPEGQYWALPPYNWKVIEESGDRMLLERIQTYGRLYDLYRLDSCLGYFAQFEIPLGRPAKEGAYFPSNEDEAIQNGKKVITSFINEVKNLLPYAEAFAMSPRMYQVLEDFGIAKLKTFVGTNTTYSADRLLYSGKDLPILELFMLSNHDNLPLRRWWFENPEKAGLISKYYGWNYEKILTTEQQRQLIDMVYEANPIFHINMLYDLLPANLTKPPEEEGINVPGTYSDKNWTYRFKPSVEELITNSELRSLATPKLREKISKQSS